MDEKSLIKKYQREISELKQELEQWKRGMIENPNMATSSQEDLVTLKLQVGAVASIIDHLKVDFLLWWATLKYARKNAIS